TLPDSFSVPFPVRILFPAAVGGPFVFRLPFGDLDFIRVFSAELIGFVIRIRNRVALRKSRFR
ncbi:hypothetical protein ACWCXB_36095, partial [Streptomyces sp. NPDC001514]